MPHSPACTSAPAPACICTYAAPREDWGRDVHHGYCHHTADLPSGPVHYQHLADTACPHFPGGPQ